MKRERTRKADVTVAAYEVPSQWDVASDEEKDAWVAAALTKLYEAPNRRPLN